MVPHLESEKRVKLAELIWVGVVCIIGAIIGGGLKAFGIEMPIIPTLRRQLALAGFGGILLAIGLLIPSE
jgi:hypothetical protein